MIDTIAGRSDLTEDQGFPIQRAVWKYPLADAIDMPRGARLLHVALQDGTPCVWALVILGEPLERRRFCACGTGHVIPGGATYVGTWQEPPFVWHIFEIES